MTIYTDNAATTRMSDTAVAAMLPCLQGNYGNPSSLHSVGQQAAEARGGEDGLIVGLAAAGDEVNFARGGVQAFCDAVARAEQRPGRLLADGMQA